MFIISKAQYIIIFILILIIILYCLFFYLYFYVFNKVDIIHYKMKMAKTLPLVYFDKKYFEETKILKDEMIIFINKIIMCIFNFIDYGFQTNENLKRFIHLLIADFYN